MSEHERLQQLLRRLQRLEAMDIHLAQLQARINRLKQKATNEFVRARRRLHAAGGGRLY